MADGLIRTLLARAFAAIEAGQAEEGRQAARRLLILLPANPVVIQLFANACSLAGDDAASMTMAWLARGYALAPQDIVSRCNFAACLDAAGGHGAAGYVRRGSIAFVPGEAVLWRDLAQNLTVANLPGAALWALARAVRIDPAPPWAPEIGRIIAKSFDGEKPSRLDAGLAEEVVGALWRVFATPHRFPIDLRSVSWQEFSQWAPGTSGEVFRISFPPSPRDPRSLARLAPYMRPAPGRGAATAEEQVGVVRNVDLTLLFCDLLAGEEAFFPLDDRWRGFYSSRYLDGKVPSNLCPPWISLDPPYERGVIADILDPDRVAEIPPECLLLSPRRNLGHWLGEIFPKLVLYREHFGCRGLKVFMPIVSDYQRELIAIAGYADIELIDGRKYLDCAPGRYVKFRAPRASVVEDLRCDPGTAIARYALEPRLPYQPGNWPRRVFLSRRNFPRPKHRIENEAAVWSVLERMGFVRVDVERASVVDTLQLSRHADIVVAPFGASIINGCVFPPRLSWISLINRRVWTDNLLTRTFAEDVGLLPDHRFVFGDPTGPDLGHPVAELDNPINLDIAALAAAIDEAGVG